MESDWRYFRDLVPRVRERYIAERLEQVRAVMTRPNKTPTACFWEVLEAMEHHATVLRRCLDGHSRSKMRAFLGEMMRSGMLQRDDLHGFSPELQKSLTAQFTEKAG